MTISCSPTSTDHLTLNPVRAAWTSLLCDLKRIQRDRFAFSMTIYVLGLAVLMRWAIPWAAEQSMERWSFDLRPYYPLMTGYLGALTGAMLVGVIGGFALLETREQGTARAILVSPFSLSSYIRVLIATMIAVATAVITVQVLIIGVGHPGLLPTLLCATAVAPFAPLAGLFLASFSDNRVEAFAYAKFVSTTGLVPVIAWFLPDSWHFLAGFVPPYWGIKALWLAESGSKYWIVYLIPGFLLSAICLWFLAKKFQAVARH